MFTFYYNRYTLVPHITVCFIHGMRQSNARERILDTAANLFTRKGYALVGINEIIAESKTAKASFYQYFPSKDDLCAAWLKRMHERSVEHHSELLKSPTLARERILTYFKDLKDWLTTNEYRGCPYTTTSSMLKSDAPAIREQIESHKRFLRDFFIDLASQHVQGPKARQLGSMLFLLYSGATAESQNVRSTWPVDTAIESVSELCNHE